MKKMEDFSLTSPCLWLGRRLVGIKLILTLFVLTISVNSQYQFSNQLSNGNYISYKVTLTSSLDTASRHFTASSGSKVSNLIPVFPTGYKFNIILLNGDSVQFSHDTSFTAGTITYLKSGALSNWISPLFENTNTNPDYYIKLWGVNSAAVEIRIDGY